MVNEISNLLRRFNCLTEFSKENHPKLGTKCLMWKGAVGKLGYGHMLVGSRKDDSRRTVTVSRVSWELFRGEIPEGMCVCHRCDNPACVNVEHLFLGTVADNNLDCRIKGRHGSKTKPDAIPRGEARAFAKLKPGDILAIRSSAETQRSLADRYGVRQSTISLVRLRKSWKHIV